MMLKTPPKLQHSLYCSYFQISSAQLIYVVVYLVLFSLTFKCLWQPTQSFLVYYFIASTCIKCSSIPILLFTSPLFPTIFFYDCFLCAVETQYVVYPISFPSFYQRCGGWRCVSKSISHSRANLLFTRCILRLINEALTTE